LSLKAFVRYYYPRYKFVKFDTNLIVDYYI
jgi:hypothetical protein